MLLWVLWVTCFCFSSCVGDVIVALLYETALFLYHTLYRFPPKLWRATPLCCLSSLIWHLIPSRPISSLLICSSNHNNHPHTYAHLHQTTANPHQAQTPGLFEALSVNDFPPLYCSVKPKVQLYKGFGTSMRVSTHECAPFTAGFSNTLWFLWSSQCWTLNPVWGL